MDITANRRKHKALVDTQSNSYDLDLSFFEEIPRNQIHIKEFQELGVERVQLLRTIELATLKGFKYFSEDWLNCIKEELIKANLKKYVRLMSGLNGQSEIDIQARRADHLSNYILRLSYCGNEDSRKWFINYEMDWFRIKFAAQTSETIHEFLRRNNFKYIPLTYEQKQEIMEELILASNMNEAYIHSTEFYKIQWSEVPTVVQKRKVYLENGFCYVPLHEMGSSVQVVFRAKLSATLASMNKKLPLLEDFRLDDILPNLHHAVCDDRSSATDITEVVPIKDLDNLSKKAFPLCMRYLHEALKIAHHLRHAGRLTYGLYLKSIGVRYEEFIRFWRMEFTKSMDDQRFDKEYLYGFQHQYGKVGSCTNYAAYNCMKIISSSVGPSEYHGCPFKHRSDQNLKAKFIEYGLSRDDIHEILDLSNDGHYQIACSKYFEVTHAAPPSVPISHPSTYFTESKKFSRREE